MSEEEKVVAGWANEEFQKKLMERFEKFEAHTVRQLGNLERHVLNIILPLQNIREIFNDNQKIRDLTELFSQPIQIDDRKLQYILEEFKKLLRSLEKALEAVNLSQTLSEIKYIGNRLDTVEHVLNDIQKEIRNRSVRIYCDNKEMGVMDDTKYIPKKPKKGVGRPMKLKRIIDL